MHYQRSTIREQNSFWRACRKAWVVLLAIAAPVSVASAQSDSLSAKSLLGETVSEGPAYQAVDAAVNQFKSGDVSSASESLKSAVENHPELPPAQVMLARLLMATNNGTAARSLLESAVVNSPKDPEAYLLFAEGALKDRRYTDGEALIEKAYNLNKAYDANPKRKDLFTRQIYSGMATVSEQRRDWDRASTALSYWLQLDPQSAVAKQRLARVEFMQGKHDQAYQTLQAAKQLDTSGKMPAPELTMGQLFQQQDDQANARKYMMQAARNAGNDTNTLLAVAQWMLENEQPQDAQQYAQSAMRADPDSLPAKVMRGVIARMQGDLDTAENVFAAAHVQSPLDFTASNQLALTLVEQFDPEKQRRALQYAQANRRLFPNSSDAASTLGWIQYRLGNSNAAQQELASAVRLAGSSGLSADSNYYVAKIYYDIQKFNDAAKHLKDALAGRLSYPLRRDARELAQLLQRSQ